MDRELYERLRPHFKKPHKGQKNLEEFSMREYAAALADEVGDVLVMKFYDPDSYEMLDLKIDVLERLDKGETIDDIGDDYYKILEKYPSGEEGFAW